MKTPTRLPRTRLLLTSSPPGPFLWRVWLVPVAPNAPGLYRVVCGRLPKVREGHR